MTSTIAGSALGLSLLGTTASAQNDRLVEDPRRRTVAQETTKTTDCDRPTLTVVRTENAPVTFTNTDFLNPDPGSRSRPLETVV